MFPESYLVLVVVRMGVVGEWWYCGLGTAAESPCSAKTGVRGKAVGATAVKRFQTPPPTVATITTTIMMMTVTTITTITTITTTERLPDLTIHCSFFHPA